MQMVTKLHLAGRRRPAGSRPVSTSLRTPPRVTGLGRTDPQARRPAAALPVLTVWALAVGLCLAFWAGLVVLLVSLV